MNKITQTGNTVGGNLVAGDMVVNDPRRTPITELNARYIAASGNQEGLEGFIEEIQHYLNKATNGDIRPLAQKLTESNRADIIHDCELMKERATKLILKYQTSYTAQKLLSYILAELYGRFTAEVRPTIQAGADRAAVDSQFSQIVGQTLSDLEENVLGLIRTDLMGLMYFLTGNCHIRWDKC